MTNAGITQPCSADELRTLFLFEGLSSEQLAWLCREGHAERVEPGQVYAEGDPARCLYVLLDGALVLSRRVGADGVEVIRTSERGVTREPSLPTSATGCRRPTTTRCG